MSGYIGLADYQRAERELAFKRERTGLAVHAIITLIVSVALVAINIFLATEFPWSPFPVVGMSIGLVGHYAGTRRLDEVIARRQAEIEAAARRLVA
jgi:hypothetical protein